MGLLAEPWAPHVFLMKLKSRAASLLPDGLVWLLMFLYWFVMAQAAVKYFNAASQGNFDAYSGYLLQAAVWNFPMRFLDETFAISGRVLGSFFSHGSDPRVSGVAGAAVEIMLVDVVAGSCFYLAVFQLIARKVRKVIGRRGISSAQSVQ